MHQPNKTISHYMTITHYNRKIEFYLACIWETRNSQARIFSHLNSQNHSLLSCWFLYSFCSFVNWCEIKIHLFLRLNCFIIETPLILDIHVILLFFIIQHRNYVLLGVYVTSTFLAHMARRIRKERHFFWHVRYVCKVSFFVTYGISVCLG